MDTWNLIIHSLTRFLHESTGTKPVWGPKCLIPYVNIYGIIHFEPKTGLAPVHERVLRNRDLKKACPFIKVCMHAAYGKILLFYSFF